MSRRPFLKSISAAAPCTSRWAAMPGTDRVRRCSACGNCVYRVQGLSTGDGDALIAWAEGRAVGSRFTRDDGTVMTRDCSLGRQAEQARLHRLGRSRWAALGFVVVGFLGLAASAPEERPPSHAAIPLAAAEGVNPGGVASSGHAKAPVPLSNPWRLSR